MIYDIELINFFIKIIQKYISENIYRRKKKRIPYRKTIDLLEKLFFTSENMCLHSVKINNEYSQYIETGVNRDKNKRHLKCDYCNFSFNYMIHTKHFFIAQTKLWIPPLCDNPTFI